MRINRILAIGMGVFALTVASQAATLTFHNMVAGKHSTSQINYNGNGSNVYAGAMNIDVDGTFMEAYCVDLDHHIGFGDSWQVTAQSYSILSNASTVYNVFANGEAGVNSNDKGAGLQLAIWDALVDNGDGIGAGMGNFKATPSGSIASEYASFITGGANAPSMPVSVTVWQAVSHGPNGDKFQNLITLNPVPEPATMVVLGGALAAAVARRRRK